MNDTLLVSYKGKMLSNKQIPPLSKCFYHSVVLIFNGVNEKQLERPSWFKEAAIAKSEASVSTVKGKDSLRVVELRKQDPV